MNGETKPSSIQLGCRRTLRKRKKDQKCCLMCTNTSPVKVMNEETKPGSVKLGCRKRNRKKDPECSMTTGASQMNVMSNEIKPCFVRLERLKAPQINKPTAKPSFCMEGLSHRERINYRIDQWLNSMEIVWPQVLLDLNDNEDNFDGTVSRVFNTTYS